MLNRSQHAPFLLQKPGKRKVLQVGWEKNEIGGAARKLMSAGLVLRDTIIPHNRGDDSLTSKRRKNDVVQAKDISPPKPVERCTCSEQEIRAGEVEMEEYIDNMDLNCDEALEVWAAYYGADLYGSRMSVKQLASLNDFSND